MHFEFKTEHLSKTGNSTFHLLVKILIIPICWALSPFSAAGGGGSYIHLLSLVHDYCLLQQVQRGLSNTPLELRAPFSRVLSSSACLVVCKVANFLVAHLQDGFTEDCAGDPGGGCAKCIFSLLHLESDCQFFISGH